MGVASFTFPRAAGVLMPLASLPSRHGVGDLGPEAYRFVDWLCAAGVTWWQMLPVGPLGPGNSPYASSSAFAGEPLYVSLERLVDDGLLEANEASGPRELRSGNARYGQARKLKTAALHSACEAWDRRRPSKRTRAFDEFCDREAHWLDAWAGRVEGDEAQRHERVLQFFFQRQWDELRAYAKERGVRLIGDAPIFVGRDSVDVTSRPELFRLRPDGSPEVLTGCPPDAMNADGQLWGHPHYDWDAHRSEDYGWWRARMRRQLELFDVVRIDHFIGFRNAWEVSGDAENAREGFWAHTPGEELLDAIKDEIGSLPLIAEDLGSVTDEVLALRDAYGLPGMRVLQWGFSPNSFHAPHAAPENSIVYPATHDNDTCVGWWRGLSAHEKKRFRTATGGEGKTVGSTMTRIALGTRAHTAIVQIQDLLGLGRATRTNTPGTATGNWGWRVSRADLSAPRARRFRELLDATDRLAP
ncbi:MAG: 4-alpha-glucanotransferase [Planctomycetota bacterium]